MERAVLEIRGVRIGEGMPKICVPIIERSQEEILAAAVSLRTVPCDMVEWRADWFNMAPDPEAVCEVLTFLRGAIGNVPVIFTFRSDAEGGERPVSPAEYDAMIRAVAESAQADLIDVECAIGDERAGDLIRHIHACGCRAVVSAHYFNGTPEKHAIVDALRHMQGLGADIPKIACMAKTPADVLALLSAGSEMAEHHATRPIITISMGALGMVSRISGEVFGSAVTFGADGKGSAPGQLQADDLGEMLRRLHVEG